VTTVGLEVGFQGEDGRTWKFSFATSPLPGWHIDLAAAFARRTGPTGTLRTLASAQDSWGTLQRLLGFLDTLPRPPQNATQLTVRHLRQFQLHRQRTCCELSLLNELRTLRRLLGAVAPDRLRPEVVDWLAQRRPVSAPHPGRSGYSNREFLQIMQAARGDVAAIRDRLRVSARLLTLAASQPHALDADQRASAAQLADIARTGEVPDLRVGGRWDTAAQLRVARRLFVVEADLAPLLVLGVGVTGRNGETLKELPTAHELLDERVVAVELAKRRRGPGKAFQMVHWEIGQPSRQLHTPGGYYLLVEELCRRGRTFSASRSVWSSWNVRSGHVDPFEKQLHRPLYLRAWVRRHDLRGDDGQPLELDLNRLKTTVEVRRTKAAGGHLPSSTRTNTMDVLFSHYLRGDPTVLDWAADEVTAAINDAEQQARRAHLRVLAEPVEQAAQDLPALAGKLQVHPEIARQALAGELDTAFAACLDIRHSPFNDGICQASFLTCFQCPNALATQQHLPALLALLDRLEIARQAMDTGTWWDRHGRTWRAITEDILPRFTPAEIAKAKAARPADLPLDLLDGPKEQP
jgi:hypothetical protein